MRVAHPVVVPLVALAVVVGFGAAGVPTQATADVSVRGSQEIPHQTIAIGNEQFSVTHLAVHDPGETLTADVTVSRDEVYRVYVYNIEGEVIAQRREETDATVEFDIASDVYDAGSYLLTVDQDGVKLDVHPVLVRGYDVRATAPSSAESGDEIVVEGSLDHRRGPTLEYVGVVVTDGSNRVRARASVTGEGYSATVDLDGLPAGAYEVYATVRGGDEAFDEPEFLGVSHGRSLSITESSSGSSGSTGGGGDGGSTGGTPATGTAPETSTTTPTSDPGDGATAAVTATDTDAPPDPVTTSPSPTITDSGVVTPAGRTPPISPTATDGQPGFGIIAIVTALGVLLLGRRL